MSPVAIDIVLLVLFMGFVVLVVAGFRRRERLAEERREERANRSAEQWEAAVALARSRPGLRLIKVEQNYQRSSTGTKSWVRRWDTDARQDAWFSGKSFAPGTLLVVSATSGWGPHNQDPGVLYVRPDQIIKTFEPRAS